jgi:hypothetical protein
MSKNKMRKAGLILSVLTSGTLIGYIGGQISSPNANKPITARIEVAMYGKWQRLGPTTGRYSFTEPKRKYSYATADSKVSIDDISAEKLAASSIPKSDYADDFAKLMPLVVAPPVTTGIWVAILEATGKAGEVITRPEKILLGAATLGGSALGFLVGHKSQPDFDNPVFENTLEMHPELWAEVERNCRAEYEVAVNRLFLKLLVGPEEFNNLEKQMHSASDDNAKFSKNFLALHPEIEQQAWQDPIIVNELREIRGWHDK